MIQVSLSADEMLVLETSVVTLRDAQPILNGMPLSGWTCEVLHVDDKHIELLYKSPALGSGSFQLQVAPSETEKRISVRYWLENPPPDLTLDSFGLRFEQVENVRQFLRNGYFSWDGSYYVQPDTLPDVEEGANRLETGYGMCQFLPRSGTGSLILGFDRHDRFQQTFTFDTSRQPLSLTIQTWWDRKDRSGLERCESEHLMIFGHPEIENGLREWARLVASASPTPPRLASPPITGWCSWYNLYAYINEENILDHLHAAQTVAVQENLPMRVFQIDDGFTPEMGDWLEVKPQFPRGMKLLLDDIRSAAFIPGLWIAPFMVGNRSHLYRDHPDWVVKDRQSGGPLAHMRFYGEFRWHKRSEEYYILDATHPDAFDYLRNVFHIWRHEWGCEYFKTDFMHFGSEYGPDRAIWHTPGMTRIEIWRHMAEMIRQEIGDALWLGCGCPLWASIGLVDGVRIGRDVGVAWSGDFSAQSLLRDQACRNFANHILWQSDPDCVLLRERFSHLSKEEIKSLAIYAGMTGGVMMTSDHLGELSADRLELWRLVLHEGRASCEFPLLGHSQIFYERISINSPSAQMRDVPRAEDAVLVQVRHSNDTRTPGAVFFLNTANHTLQRTYALADLGINGPVYVYDCEKQSSNDQLETKMNVTLRGHHSALYFFSAGPIEERPARLPF
ncbi:MAG TPA: glycoside hydrolase family 36 protein [Anaerolineales bacterium]|nr:glycoside hydrolase family 36 protein [Anaerolineales bacterium]